MEAQAAETLRTGELTPAELLSLADAAAAHSEGREALYDGLRVTVAGLLRSHAQAAELEEWRDVLTHLSGLARMAAVTDPNAGALLAQRLDTLRDLSADAIAYQHFYSAERLGEFPLYRKLLAHLKKAGDSAPRNAIVKALSLTESNATRVLKLLENARLLRRRRIGGEVHVTLSSEGNRLLSHWAAEDAPDDGSRVFSLTARLRVRGGAIDGVPQAEIGYSAGSRRLG